MDSLVVLKALGDDTRYSMYRELLESTVPLSTHDLAARMDLHANTVRLHLERLRDAGLVVVEAVHSGTVGRPHHRYSVAPGSPGLAAEPLAADALATMLACLAERTGASSEDSVEVGSSWVVDSLEGRARPSDSDGVDALAHEMERLGFEPSVEHNGSSSSVLFRHCPFSEHAEAHPEVVCNLHRGICEGVVGRAGGNIEAFSTLYDGTSCRATLATSISADS